MKNTNFSSGILMSLFFLFSTVTYSYSQKAFPDAVGFGAKCKGAYAGSKTPKILIVDTLCNASTGNELTGRGSFRWAASRSYPRVIIFEISGYIDLQSAVNIYNPYVTIAGQTAPSPGVTFRYYPVEINTHDVIVQHLRFRLGDLTAAAGSFDAFSVYSGPNTYIDHCSFSWAIDENISCSSKDLVKNVTISNCIISEALYQTPNPNSPNSYGMLLYKGDSISIMNNLFADLGDRAPMVNNTANDILIVNNLLFNTGCSNANIYFNTNSVKLKASAVGNTFIRGANSTSNKIVRVKADLYTGSKIYLEDNEDIGRTDDPWSVVTGEKNKFRTNTREIWDKNFIPVSSKSLEKYLLPRVGARPLDRDLVDKRAIDQVVNRNGKMINSQNEVSGYPVLAKNKRSLKIPANPHADDNKNGYTNLEDWLYQFHQQLIGSASLKLVTGITVTGANSITTNGGQVQLNATIAPTDASNKTVAWSIQNGTGSASISSAGLVTAVSNGTVTAKATATDGSGISGSLVITISNQSVAAGSGPIAWYKFENSGIDASGNGHNGTLVNGAMYSSSHKEGTTSLLFDGSNDYVNIGTINLGTKFTFTSWVYIPSGYSKLLTVAANAGSGGATNGFRIFINTYGTTDRKIILETGNGTQTAHTETPVSTFVFNGWNHLAVVADQTTGQGRIYFNGHDVTTFSSLLTNFSTNRTIWLGQMTNSAFPMPGNLDDTRFYNRLLSASEIASMANTAAGTTLKSTSTTLNAGSATVSASPNPFTDELTIDYNLPENTHVNLAIYDLNGKLIRSLVNENQAEGSHRIVWDAMNSNGNYLHNGLYLIKIESASGIQIEKIIHVQ
jgi:uncharacterized protein YjdB